MQGDVRDVLHALFSARAAARLTLCLLFFI